MNITKINMLNEEYWWGGAVQDGIHMPFGKGYLFRDLSTDLSGNQGMPLLISSKGRFIWSENPFSFTFDNGAITIISEYEVIKVEEGFENLKGALNFVSNEFFYPSGKYPEPLLFTAPQYNTWIEMMYEPTQEKVLKYAENILANGMEPGVLMIDDNWQQDYGDWTFHPARFPDPGEMVEKLHKLGFKVMLWVCNFISPDSEIFRMLRDKQLLVKEQDGSPAICSWWNGYSGLLDSTNETAVDWFMEQLDILTTRYGIDGFKFDAGDLDSFKKTYVYSKPSNSNSCCESWGKIGLKYLLNEYRACWKLAGQPLAQRLSDKRHLWDKKEGLGSLIPNGLAQGLIGHSFVCPDMIGGGNFIDFLDANMKVDQELVVRYAQCSALFPMMQFSAAPWRILDENHLQYCVDAAALHTKMGGEIMELVKHAAKTGEPIIKHMEYVFPGCGYETVCDQFFLGDDILVAPVIEKGALTRTILFPEGKWLGDDGSLISGPSQQTINAPLSRLPWYRRK